MANRIYANNMEVSCKAAGGKAICAFPDVCFTPPQSPATPLGVPVPYPNTGMASDTSNGSTTVTISGQEVMLKNKSYFKKSTGDEAGCAPKKGILTNVNMGKVYFNSWSMNVLIEGENVVRNLDLTTHNHASFPGNSPTWPYIDEVAFESDSSHPCAPLAKKLKSCEKQLVIQKNGKVSRKKSVEKICTEGDADCRDAMQCVLTPKEPSNCCPEKPGEKSATPHHIVPDAQFYTVGAKGTPLLTNENGENKYSYDKAPCICAQGEGHSEGRHGQIHGETNTRTRAFNEISAGRKIPDDLRWPVAFAERVGAEAVSAVFGCPKQCIEAQLREGHEAMGISRSERIRPMTAGGEAEAGGPIPL